MFGGYPARPKGIDAVTDEQWEEMLRQHRRANDVFIVAIVLLPFVVIVITFLFCGLR